MATYTLVKAADTELSEGNISIYTPLAQGLLGCQVGMTRSVLMPDGPHTFKILTVKLPNDPPDQTPERGG